MTTLTRILDCFHCKLMPHLEANTAAKTIIDPPKISLIDETSPNNKNAQTAAKTDSKQRMMFDSLADVSF